LKHTFLEILNKPFDLLKTKHLLLFLLICCSAAKSIGQSARIKGVILDENKQPVRDVTVSAANKTTISDATGFYALTVPANQKVVIVFSHVSLKKITLTQNFSINEDFEFNPVLNTVAEQMQEVTIVKQKRDRIEGITNIDPATIRRIPGANAGVENILKTFAGVNSNNELSTQYSVRGGNFDENLVYVNEIEVYRPFLIRSGQQEGLSFTNTDMVENVDFSAGGFQAKFGDRLSSVLDITYRIPKKFGVTAEASFLGGSLAVEGVSKDQKWTGILGLRYRDNSLLVNSQETQSNFRPTFADIQTYFTYTPSTKWRWSFLGNISQNKYHFQPLTRQTNFGTIDDPIALSVFYQGQENDAYSTYFGAVKSVYEVNENFTLKLIGSAYHTTEQEYFDILAQYSLGEVDGNLGSETIGAVTFSEGVGSQLNHARNNLDALIFNAEVKGINKVQNNTIEWGFKYTLEDIRDRVVEWEVIDSAGFSLNPPKFDFPNNQPAQAYIGPLVPFQNVRATNFVTVNRFSGYAQWSKKDKLGTADIWYNAGIRGHQWTVSGDNLISSSQFVFSPRASIAIKPEWQKDMVLRVSGGLYHQPPFYRELRNQSGTVIPNVKAQQAAHLVLSNDYSFKMWNRPFKLVTELYYKSLTNVNPYTLENVRIRYAATNNAKAFAQGLDVRLNGEFVPGTESWLSFGYMKTEENIDNRGYIARPTDQRLKFAALFQDYMPNIPSVKVYLNVVYNTGLPGGSPSYADPYVYQSRLRDYRRADAGFSYVLTENNANRADSHWLKNFEDLSIGFEIFNLFNNQNAITNTWVRDVYTKNQYGIPNYLTTRVFNIKFSAKL
jgi:hypothetical protein